MKEQQTDYKKMSRVLKSQMVLSDLSYDRIGKATGRAWRYRVNNPGRMTVEDLEYLLARMNLKIEITNN